MDIVDLLLNGDPVAAQKRQAALLRGKQDFQKDVQGATEQAHGLDLLNFAAANANNPVLAKSLGSLSASQQSQYAPQKLDKGLYVPATGAYHESPGVADEKEADRRTREVQAAGLLQARQESEATRQEAIAQRAIDAEANRTLRLTLGQLALEGRNQRNADRAERDADKKAAADAKMVERYGNTLSKAGIPQIAEAVAGVHNLLDKKAGTIDGMGYGQATLSKIPVISDWTVGESGKANRSVVQKVINALTLTEAGKAVTANELVRQELVNMAGDKYSEADFRNGMKNVILPALESARSNALRSYDPKVRQQYMDNEPTLGFDPSRSFLHMPKDRPSGLRPKPSTSGVMRFDNKGNLISQ